MLPSLCLTEAVIPSTHRDRGISDPDLPGQAASEIPRLAQHDGLPPGQFLSVT
jgi:hypothetical protein